MASLVQSWPARAQTLPKPQGKVVLTVSGLIGQTNGEGNAAFDIAMLEALGMASFTTVTPWYSGAVAFEGVRMATLLDRIAAAGSVLTARSLDDYSIDIPVEDFRKYEVLLALKRDGSYLPPRDKGPLFIVYPYDSKPELRRQRFYSRSAWHVARMVLK